MADNAKAVLQKFALHIQLTSTECENASAVAHRYLALHVNVVPAASAYATIADDFKVVEMRTHTPSIKTYSTINIPTFVYLMSTIPNDTVRLEAFARFSEDFFPRPVGEERWKSITRAGQWKEKATFLALNFKNAPNLYGLIEALHGKQNAAALHQRVRSYKVGATFKPDELLHDTSAIIKQVAVPLEDMVLLARNQLPEEIAPIAAERALVPMKKVIVIKTSPSTKTLEELRPQMEAYRKRAGLNVTVSSAKVAKQMLFTALGTPVKQLPANVLGIHQKALTPLADEAELKVALDALQAFAVVDMENANASAYLVALASACKQHEWDSRTLLHNAIVTDARTQTRVTRACPDGVATDAVVISAIENLK